jgi:hypothetical protein
VPFAEVECIPGLLAHVMTFLAAAQPPRDLIMASAVSRAWSAAAESQHVWQALCAASPLPAKLHRLNAALRNGFVPRSTPRGVQSLKKPLAWRKLMHAAFDDGSVQVLAGGSIADQIEMPSPEDYLISLELYTEHGDHRTPLLSALSELGRTQDAEAAVSLVDTVANHDATLLEMQAETKILIDDSHVMHQGMFLPAQLVRKADGKKLALFEGCEPDAFDCELNPEKA